MLHHKYDNALSLSYSVHTSNDVLVDVEDDGTKTEKEFSGELITSQADNNDININNNSYNQLTTSMPITIF